MSVGIGMGIDQRDPVGDLAPVDGEGFHAEGLQVAQERQAPAVGRVGIENTGGMEHQQRNPIGVGHFFHSVKGEDAVGDAAVVARLDLESLFVEHL